MTKLTYAEADALAKRIENGESWAKIGAEVLKALRLNGGQEIYHALCGSLDACQAIMREVLPGWVFALEPHECTVWRPDMPMMDTPSARGKSTDTAHAWLASMVRAMGSMSDE